MQVYGATFVEAASAASVHNMVAVPAYAPRGATGIMLRPEPAGNTYRKWLPNDRRVNAVCWHGHARWLRELFARYGARPGLRVISSVPGRPFGGRLRFQRATIYPNCALVSRWDRPENAGESFNSDAWEDLLAGRLYAPLDTGRFVLSDWLDYSRDLNVGSEWYPRGAAESCRCES